MSLQGEALQRHEFKELLFFLAKSQEVLKEKADRQRIYRRLEEIYHIPGAEKPFRHFYSDIFAVLTTVKQKDREGAIEFLAQNLAQIRNGYMACNKDVNGEPIDIGDSIRKLDDHVNLEMARLSYSDGEDRRISGAEALADISALQSQIKDVGDRVEAMAGKVNESVKIAENSQKDYIAILGVFSAVVLTFTAGIGFSTSVLQNMHQVSAYRIIIVCRVLGFVLHNVLYALFYYIDRLADRGRENKLRNFWWINLMFIGLMIATVLCWKSGMIEARNMSVGNSLPVVEQYDDK